LVSARQNRKAFTLIELLMLLFIIGGLAAMAAPLYATFAYKMAVTKAKEDIGVIERAMSVYKLRHGYYPASLSEVMEDGLFDPWGHPYQYVLLENGQNLALSRRCRRERPLNTDYDLYSKGVDGLSQLGLTALVSQDDIVRARNGGFCDIAFEYD
jgi:general secretion pathway protein G